MMYQTQADLEEEERIEDSDTTTTNTSEHEQTRKRPQYNNSCVRVFHNVLQFRLIHFAPSQDEERYWNVRIWHRVVFFMAMLLCSALLTIAAYYIPATDLTEWSGLDKAVYTLYGSHYFHWDKAFLWLTHLFLGFIVVSGVTEGRKNPFTDRQGTYMQIINVFSPRFFMLTEYVYIWVPLFWLSPYITLGDNQDISLADYIGMNYSFFGIFFCLGIQFTYFDYIPALQTIVIRSTKDKSFCQLVKEMPTLAKFTIVVAVSVILTLGGFHVYLMISTHLWPWYLIAYVAFYAILGAVHILSKRYCPHMHHHSALHIHHYLLVGQFLFLLRFPFWVTRGALGFCAGVYIEGIARWGMGSTVAM